MIDNIYMKKIICLLVVICSNHLFGDGKAFSPAEKSMQNSAPIPQSTHTLSEILNGGRIIVLEDGSQWEVHPDDIDKSGGWLGPADVVLSLTKDNTYKYQIFNDWTNSSVRVRPYTPPGSTSTAPSSK